LFFIKNHGCDWEEILISHSSLQECREISTASLSGTWCTPTWCSEPNAIKIQGSVITGSCKYRKNLQDPVVFKMNAIKHIFPVFTGIFL
jgi:hypothetical protein